MMHHVHRALPIALASALPLSAQCVPAWAPGDPIPGLLGNVAATVFWDADGPSGPLPLRLIVGGRFRAGTMVDTGIAAHDGAQWAPLGAPPPGNVTALAVFNGQLVAAFETVTTILTTPVYSTAVAMFDGTTWTTLGTAPSIGAMAVYQGELVVGGSFNLISGTAANNLARWNGSAWQALGTGVAGRVHALAVFSGGLYVGGSFGSAGGVAAGNLAVWNGAWSATAPLNGTVRALATRISANVATSYLFAGGDFTTIGTGPGQVAANRVARMTATAPVTWSALAGLPGTSCTALYVRSIGLNSFELTAGVADSTSSQKLWRWTGSAWAALGSILPTAAWPAAIAYYGGRYTLGLAGGGTDAFGLQTYDGSAWAPVLGAGILGQVLAVTEGNGDYVIGGGFTTISGTVVDRVARGTPGAWSPMGTGFTGTVRALARATNGDIVAGGDFTGATGSYVSRWNGSAWAPLGASLGGPVHALLALSSGHLLAGGSFLAPSAVGLIQNVARWDGAAWTPLGGGTNGPVHALALLPNGDVVVGGAFSSAGGVPVQNVARWSGSAWSPLGSGFAGTVRALATLADGGLAAGGTAPTWLSRWTGTQWVQLGSSFLVDDDVHAIAALPDGGFVAGGRPWAPFSFPGFPGGPPGNLVRVQSGGGLGLFGGLRGASVDALVFTPTGELLVGGDFASVPNVASANFARHVTPCPATATSYGPTCSGSAGPIAMTAVQRPWIGATYRAVTTGMDPNGLAFDLLAYQAASIPLPAISPVGTAGCELLVQNAVSQLLLPVNGAATSQLAIPNNAAFVGIVLRNQVFQLVLGPAGVVAMNSSNGLRLSVGAF